MGEGFQEEIKTGPDLRLCRVTGFSGLFDLKIESDVALKRKVSIYLGEELECLRSDKSAGQKQRE